LDRTGHIWVGIDVVDVDDDGDDDDDDDV